MTKIKKGALRKQLGIPAEKKVPKSFVKKIANAQLGDVVKNPTAVGKSYVKVTKKLHKRAFFLTSFM